MKKTPHEKQEIKGSHTSPPFYSIKKSHERQEIETYSILESRDYYTSYRTSPPFYSIKKSHERQEIETYSIKREMDTYSVKPNFLPYLWSRARNPSGSPTRNKKLKHHLSTRRSRTSFLLYSLYQEHRHTRNKKSRRTLSGSHTSFGLPFLQRSIKQFYAKQEINTYSRQMSWSTSSPNNFSTIETYHTRDKKALLENVSRQEAVTRATNISNGTTTCSSYERYTMEDIRHFKIYSR
ncbi:hypothetical protein BJ508DRAFT_314911 [Ascobolus immersus RN42]|uniref:Uncharacterized protein n=1 Tax=Ascobolus immersus RN42 TaxID=1160509 RepID=A0A3N4HD53_ASCIM|nr:hypothetical protein BJ508DRAFT_314911 [Ascobolus immersus RN42]